MRRLLVVASLALLTQAGMAQNAARHKPQPLSDAAMDRVTAGGSYSRAIEWGRELSRIGTDQERAGYGSRHVGGADRTAVDHHEPGHADVERQAQQNLSSLVNINAVNSNVNVLLNLNVNMNSTVGTLTQTNLTGKH